MGARERLPPSAVHRRRLLRRLPAARPAAAPPRRRHRGRLRQGHRRGAAHGLPPARGSAPRSTRRATRWRRSSGRTHPGQRAPDRPVRDRPLRRARPRHGGLHVRECRPRDADPRASRAGRSRPRSRAAGRWSASSAAWTLTPLTVEIRPGERLILYTDGITDGQRAGRRALRRGAPARTAHARARGPRGHLPRGHRRRPGLSRASGPADDLAFLVLRRLPESNVTLDTVSCVITLTCPGFGRRSQ